VLSTEGIEAVVGHDHDDSPGGQKMTRIRNVSAANIPSSVDEHHNGEWTATQILETENARSKQATQMKGTVQTP